MRLKHWPMESIMPTAALSVLVSSIFFFFLCCLEVEFTSAPFRGILTEHTRCAYVCRLLKLRLPTRDVRSRASAGPLLSPHTLPSSTVPPVFFPGTLAKHWPPPWSLVCTHAELAARTVPADLKDFLSFSPGTLCTCAVAPSVALGPWPFIEQQASHVRVSHASSSPCAVGPRPANVRVSSAQVCGCMQRT